MPQKIIEITTDNHDLFLTDENCIHCIVNGACLRKHAQEGTDFIFERFAEHPNRKFNFFVDLSNAGFHPADARKVITETLRHQSFNRIAIYGQSMVQQVIASFVMKVLWQQKNIRFFFNKDKATNWLSEAIKGM